LVNAVLRALGTKNDARYNLKIIDNGVGAPAPAASSDDGSFQSSDTGDNDSTADDTTLDVPHEAEPVHEPEMPAEDEHDSVVSKTRKELEEFDDLDV
jgi:hypothetical protein